ncbi:MAG: NAD(P)/FAD-dependent oxidoreductase [Oscillospiraceae bacterium]
MRRFDDGGDIVIIGGGAAGLMAAGAAAARGRRVILLEKNDRVGRKLGITGKGRCNLTNSCSTEDVLKNLPSNGRFLYSALSAFTPDDTMSFFRALGVELKTERGNRVFPVSDKASDIVRALERNAKKHGAEIVSRRALSIETEGGAVRAVNAEGGIYSCGCVLLATGGKTYSATGSDGWGYREAERLGHTVTFLRPSLVPLTAAGDTCARMQGLSLRNTGLTAYDERGKRIYSDFGELLFTHYGISGPMVLSLSARLGDFDRHKFSVILDLKPALDEDKLDKRILRDFEENQNKALKHSLDALLPKSAIPVVIDMAGIDPDKKTNSVTREERRRLMETIKGLRIEITGARPMEEGIITSGGVSVKEIDPSTMQSKLVRGLFFAGEIIDVDGYTGGFNLQIAWSTAQAAARGMDAYMAAKEEKARLVDEKQ